MLSPHFQKYSRENGRSTRDSSDESAGLAALAAEECDKTSIHRLHIRGFDERSGPTSFSFTLPLINVVVFALCAALAAYFVLSGLYLLGAWAASAFFAWAFLLGAAVATKKSSSDGDRKAQELRSKVLSPETSKRASAGSRSAAESYPPAGACASKGSPPPLFTEEVRLFARPIVSAPRRFQNPH